MTAADALASLCAAVDVGDDSVLPILADALADAGDARAEELRRLPAGRKPYGPYQLGHYAWWRRAEYADEAGWGWQAQEVDGAMFARLPADGRGWVKEDDAGYPTRSAALLALAAALVEP